MENNDVITRKQISNIQASEQAAWRQVIAQQDQIDQLQLGQKILLDALHKEQQEHRVSLRALRNACGITSDGNTFTQARYQLLVKFHNEAEQQIKDEGEFIEFRKTLDPEQLANDKAFRAAQTKKAADSVQETGCGG